MKILKAFGFVLLLALPLTSHADKGKYFDHAITVIFENTDYSKALQQPFLKKLADQGAHFSNFMALAHPSQGNYIAMTSGSLNGVNGDGRYDVNARNIVDLLEAKGLTWKVYAEAYPGNCFTGMSQGTYYRRHNPFISYLNIQKNPQRCAQIVEAKQFDVDVKNGSLPNYVFYVPDINNDGHDTGVAYADKWYSRTFSKYVGDTEFMKNTILISTFDESGGLFNKNQIYTSIVGGPVKPGVFSDNLNIYSLLKLMEDNWNLGDLGKFDASAAPIPAIWY